MISYSNTIDGKPVYVHKTLAVYNPATEEIIAHAPDTTKEMLDEAVYAAWKAFKTWSKTSVAERAKCLNETADALEQSAEEFMSLLTTEQGKPRVGSEWEIGNSICWLREIAKQELPEIVVRDDKEVRVVTRHVPLGICGVILPWNFPLLLAVWKIAPAVKAGNTIVCKPSPFTPLCTLKFGDMIRDIFPPGIINIISGGDELGEWMTLHPAIAKISLTGHCDTGKKVMANSACNLKRITLELGGNDAAIILPDVDPKTIAEPIFSAAFYNSAQFCVSAKRLYIHEDIYDELKSALIEYARSVKVGNGADPETDLGPIQNKPQYLKLIGILNDVKSKGQKIALGGQLPEGPGYFFPITFVDNPPENSRVVQEEAFGPIVPLLKFKDVDDVIARANNTHYGLAASVWSRDVKKAEYIAKRLEVGTVWINHVHAFAPDIPFGGHKESGVGVENSLYGLSEYTNLQTIMVKKL